MNPRHRPDPSVRRRRASLLLAGLVAATTLVVAGGTGRTEAQRVVPGCTNGQATGNWHCRWTPTAQSGGTPVATSPPAATTTTAPATTTTSPPETTTTAPATTTTSPPETTTTAPATTTTSPPETTATTEAPATTTASSVPTPSTEGQTVVNTITTIAICHQVDTSPLEYEPATLSTHQMAHYYDQGDIIPAISGQWDGHEILFPGRNLGEVRDDGLTGTQVLATGCRVPPPTSPPLGPPTSASQAVPTPSTGVPTPTPPDPVPTTTLAPTATPAEPTPTPTLAPTPSTGVPTPTPPDPVPTTTLAPTGTPAEPTPTPTAIPTLAPTPTTGAPTPTPTLAPTPTTPTDCPAGELSHNGSCYAVPELVIPPDPTVETVTAQPASGTLTPIVECVDQRNDGVNVVWFGYESTADSTISVESGPANTVSPRGEPPTLFGPGIHLFVFGVETVDAVASWTLAGDTATSGPDTLSCATPSVLTPSLTDGQPPTPVSQQVPSTVAGAATDTTEPGATTETTEPGTTDTTEPGTTDTTEPGATTETTEPGATGEPTTSQCAAGERDDDGNCSAIEPVRLVLVDNVMECDGHGIARFAAFNDNTFALEGEDVTSLVSPLRLGEDAPEVINERDIVADDGSETAALFTVRYVNAVTWTVAHDGLQASVSAGVIGAAPNPECPAAVGAATGVSGLLQTPGDGGGIPVTGSPSTVPLSLLAAFLTGIGALLLIAVRRRSALD